MKTIIFYSVLVFIALMMVGSPASTASNSDDFKKGLQLMREEEKLAHDVYLALYEKWQIPVFNNIARSESRHFEAVGYLLETFEIKDPAYAKAGKFRNKELGKLYKELVEKGSESLSAALEVGAFIEEVDIRDLQVQLGMEPNIQVETVLGNLERASHVHLRAFTNLLAARGMEYAPQVLDEETYLGITDSFRATKTRGTCLFSSDNLNRQAPNCRRNIRTRMNGRGAGMNCIYN